MDTRCRLSRAVRGRFLALWAIFAATQELIYLTYSQLTQNQPSNSPSCFPNALWAVRGPQPTFGAASQSIGEFQCAFRAWLLLLSALAARTRGCVAV
jgi:hypothetical protein